MEDYHYESSNHLFLSVFQIEHKRQCFQRVAGRHASLQEDAASLGNQRVTKE